MVNAVTQAGDLVYPNSSLAERLRQALPQARVVKSLNTAVPDRRRIVSTAISSTKDTSVELIW
ncbi:MAG TPA: hypothetical protein VF060_14785 [Trebonia sp.]